MRILPFQLPNCRLILLSPVSVCDRVAFLILLEQVKAWWEQAQIHLILLFENEGIRETIQSMVNLLPRKDVKNCYGFDINLFVSCPEKLSNLILVELDDLHKPEPSKYNTKSDEFCIPSSGDFESDLITDLSLSFSGDTASWMLSNYPLETINNIINRLNYRNLPPEKMEQLKKMHEANQARERFKRYAKQGKFDNLKFTDKNPLVSN